MAVSKDGGATFRNFKVSETPFLPAENFFFGDYTNVSVVNNVVRPIWARLHNGNLSVWTALVDPEVVTTGALEADPGLFSTEPPYPNPANEMTGFSFKLKRPGQVSLYVLDMQGLVRARLIEREQRAAGKYMEKIEFNKWGLSPGAYFITLEVDGALRQRKVLKVGE